MSGIVFGVVVNAVVYFATYALAPRGPRLLPDEGIELAKEGAVQ